MSLLGPIILRLTRPATLGRDFKIETREDVTVRRMKESLSYYLGLAHAQIQQGQQICILTPSASQIGKSICNKKIKRVHGNNPTAAAQMRVQCGLSELRQHFQGETCDIHSVSLNMDTELKMALSNIRNSIDKGRVPVLCDIDQPVKPSCKFDVTTDERLPRCLAQKMGFANVLIVQEHCDNLGGSPFVPHEKKILLREVFDQVRARVASVPASPRWVLPAVMEGNAIISRYLIQDPLATPRRAPDFVAA